MDVEFRPVQMVEDIMTAAEALHAEAMVNFESEGEGGNMFHEETEPLYQPTNSDYGQEDEGYMTCGEEDEEEVEEEEDDIGGGNNEECTDPLLSPVHEASKVPLYVGSLVSLLSATIIIMNCSRIHGVSSAFINELLHVLSQVILPQPNSLPTSEAAASSLLNKLGLGYEIIHCCANGCVLFRGPTKDANECPTCHKPRFRLHGKSMVPWKVLRHFPLIPRLKRMFATPALSSLMTWHEKNLSQDGRMRGPIDSPQWEHVTSNLSAFAVEARNLRLGLCADGVNHFCTKEVNLFCVANLPI